METVAVFEEGIEIAMVFLILIDRLKTGMAIYIKRSTGVALTQINRLTKLHEYLLIQMMPPNTVLHFVLKGMLQNCWIYIVRNFLVLGNILIAVYSNSSKCEIIEKLCNINFTDNILILI